MYHSLLRRRRWFSPLLVGCVVPVSRVIQYITGHCSTHHTVNSSTTYHKKCPTAAIILTAGFHYEKVSLYMYVVKKSDAYM